MNKVIIFGSSGGLGSFLVKQFKLANFEVIALSSIDIDFNSNDSEYKIFNLFEQTQPDIIINCAGILGHNYEDFNKIFNINLRSNWLISKFYMDNPSLNKIVKIIFIGSSSYQKGKKDYILYASSKAALYNFFEGVSSYFENSKIIFGLVNPTRIDTKMIAHLEKNPNLVYLDPDRLASEIKSFILTLNQSEIININK